MLQPPRSALLLNRLCSNHHFHAKKVRRSQLLLGKVQPTGIPWPTAFTMRSLLALLDNVPPSSEPPSRVSPLPQSVPASSPPLQGPNEFALFLSCKVSSTTLTEALLPAICCPKNKGLLVDTNLAAPDTFRASIVSVSRGRLWWPPQSNASGAVAIVGASYAKLRPIPSPEVKPTSLHPTSRPGGGERAAPERARPHKRECHAMRNSCRSRATPSVSSL